MPLTEKKTKSKYHKIVGENFKQLRLKRNLTQKAMAETLKLKNRAHISLIESGLRSLTYENMEKIEEIFSIEATSLFEQGDRKKIIEQNILNLVQHLLSEDHLFDLLQIPEPLKQFFKVSKRCNEKQIETILDFLSHQLIAKKVQL